MISPWLAAAYGLLGAAVLWRYNLAQLAWVLQALPYGAMIWTAWQLVPPYGLLPACLIVLAVVATWPRFPQQTVPEFLKGMRDLYR